MNIDLTTKMTRIFPILPMKTMMLNMTGTTYLVIISIKNSSSSVSVVFPVIINMRNILIAVSVYFSLYIII